jgi:hypothetical protein
VYGGLKSLGTSAIDVPSHRLRHQHILSKPSTISAKASSHKYCRRVLFRHCSFDRDQQLIYILQVLDHSFPSAARREVMQCWPRNSKLIEDYDIWEKRGAMNETLQLKPTAVKRAKKTYTFIDICIAIGVLDTALLHCYCYIPTGHIVTSLLSTVQSLGGSLTSGLTDASEGLAYIH